MSLRSLPPMLACLLLLAACGPQGPGKGDRNAAAVVTTTVLQPAPWVDSIEALGTARANESVTVTAKVSETVSAVLFDSGDEVRAGQVLVRLSGQAQRAALAGADADYREAQRQFERQQDLARKQLIAASQLDQQRAARDAAKARMDQVRAQLADREIRAPFAGVLGTREVSEGALVTPGTVIATLDDLAAIKLDFSVPERFLPVLARGQTVLARADAYPDQVFEGRVDALDARIDPLTRAVRVSARIDNAKRELRPGMLLRVSLQRPARDCLQVPELALQQLGQQAYLFVVGADDKVAQVPVTIGERRPGFVEIVSGVKAGDRVVVEGTVKLKPGSAVTEAAAAPAAGG